MSSLSSLGLFAQGACGLDYPRHFDTWRQAVESEKRLLAISARDHGKTTFFSRLLPVFLGGFHREFETCIISYSEGQSGKIIDKLSRMIETQPFLRELKPRAWRDTWSKSRLRFTNGSTVDSLSFGVSGRGGHYDLVVVDDPVKDFGGMGAEDQIHFFNHAIVPMVKPDGAIVVVGTYVYDQDIIEYLEANKEFKTIKSPAIEDGLPLWPERWSLDKLEARAREVGEIAFAREYLLRKVAPEGQFFKPELFKFYEALPERVECITLVDPAISVGGDYTAIVVLGRDDRGYEYVVDYANLRTDDVKFIVGKIMDLSIAYSSRLICFEAIGFQKLFKHWIYDEMRLRDKYIGVEEIKHHNKSKQARIMAMQPKIHAGHLVFKKEHREMLGQLTAFPRGAHDDLIDALSMGLGRTVNPVDLPVAEQEGTFEWWADQVKPNEIDWAHTLFSDLTH